MKKKNREFCELMATDVFEDWICVESVWGVDVFEDPILKAQELLSKDKILKRIDMYKKAYLTSSSTSKTWIKNKLVSLVQTANTKDEGMYDPSTVRYALDMLNKMDGNYSSTDTAQQVTLNMQF